ncbi:MAG: RNA methyltransferase [Chlamydiota bacterium]
MITKEIRSLQHPLIKHWKKLRENSLYRRENKKILISGKKLIIEISQKFSIDVLISTENINPIPALLHVQTTLPIIKKITGLQEPDGYAAELTLPEIPLPPDMKYLLILDQIKDPGNLGTLLRSALALGFEGVFITNETVDPFNEKVLRAARGANFFLPIQTLSLTEIFTFLQKKKFSIYIADIEGKSADQVAFNPPLALILSHESEGVNPKIQKKGTVITIPMSPFSESLNVAISGGILMYIMTRPSK